jgi:Predicted peptidase
MKPVFFAVLMMAFAGSACSASGQGVTKATAITEVFGDGQQVTAVAIQYDTRMDGTKLSPDSFSVYRNRTA